MTTDAHPTSDLQLSHWSKEPELVPRSAVQKPRFEGYRSEYDKPNGLWVSVDGEDDWEAWCKSENFGGLYEYRHRVQLAEGSNVLHIDSSLGVRVFREKYGRESGSSYCSVYIAWDMIAKGRHTKQKRTHCLRYGHPLSGDNLWIRWDGRRVCRACARIKCRLLSGWTLEEALSTRTIQPGERTARRTFQNRATS